MAEVVVRGVAARGVRGGIDVRERVELQAAAAAVLAAGDQGGGCRRSVAGWEWEGGDGGEARAGVDDVL